MKHQVRVTSIPKREPDLERFVAALLAFVLAQRQAEAEEQADRQQGDGDA